VPRPAPRVHRLLAGGVLAAAILVCPSGWSAAAGTALAASGYVAPPYWAALTRAGLATPVYAKAPSAALGSSGGPPGTLTQVPVGVEVTAPNGTARVLLKAPKGWAVVGVAASSAGIAAVEAPLASLVPTAPLGLPWRVVVSSLTGPARMAYAYTGKGGRLYAMPSVAASAGHWAAVAVGTRGGHGLSLLVTGAFGSRAVASAQVAAGIAPTRVAVGARGEIALYGLQETGHGAAPPSFPASLHVVDLWTGPGTLVSAPGGFLTVEGAAVVKVQGDGSTVPVASLPVGDTVTALSGDGTGVVFVLKTSLGAVSAWAIGVAPRSLADVASLHPTAVFLTSAGLVAVAAQRHGRAVTVRYVAVTRS